MIGAPIVIAANGIGIPIVVATNGRGIPVQIAANGRGIPVVEVEKNGIPVVIVNP